MWAGKNQPALLLLEVLNKMVKLTNGVDTIIVPSGAAEVYKRMGFKPVVENVSDDVIDDSINDEQAESVSDDEVYVNNLLEKPISRWTKEEVKKFASIKGINLNGAKTFNDAKDRVKSYLNEEDRNNSEG